MTLAAFENVARLVLVGATVFRAQVDQTDDLNARSVRWVRSTTGWAQLGTTALGRADPSLDEKTVEIPV